ncbi:MAG: rhomboid family intramembrane serine protease [Nitrosopumilus sp.]|nr:rhomboid family intramembrane serine protease [Nitrosopumilus sp.]
MFPIHDDTPRTNGRPYVNYGLIAINIIIFIYEAIITSYFSNIGNLFSNYGAVPNLILSGQNLVSLFSSMFMHGSIAHLLGNMFFLYVFGDNLEDRFGHYKYLMLYLLWGIIASFAHSIYAISTGSGDVPAIGASGAISGVLGAYLIFFPHAKIHTIIFAFFITTVRIPALAYIPFWFIMQLIFALIGQSGGVAYLAHIGGFLAGVGTAYFWKFFSHIFNGPSVVNSKIDKMSQYQPLKNDLPDTDVSPEIIIGNGFMDIIIQARGIHMDANIQTEFDNSTNILSVQISEFNKTYSIPIPNINNSVLKISSVSVLNGVIKIRLEYEQ